jgi:hypothetical protein
MPAPIDSNKALERRMGKQPGACKTIKLTGMEIKSGTILNSDMNEIRHLQPEGCPDIVPGFEFYIGKEFCHPLKALIDNRIAGIGTSIIFNKTAWLAHIIVGKDYGNKGTGYEITQKLLKDKRSRTADTF